MKLNLENIDNENYTSYDEFGYESYCYPQCMANKLEAVASLFGLRPKPHAKARILELGCAAGGTLIPFAARNPEAEVIGVDYSEPQVRAGVQQIKRLGLTNCKIIHASIADITKDWGKFDYIYSHGVYSWIPEDVQLKMFGVCNVNLNEQGIVYISYNTLPGWAPILAMRGMMVNHCQGIKDPNKKVDEAIKLMRFIHGLGNENKSSFQKQIEQELKILNGRNVSYILHEHLAEYNVPCFFSEFMNRAHKQNLQYLADTNLSAMHIQNYEKKLHDLLKKISHDILQVEQYIDYAINQRFRRSILCKNSVDVTRNLNSDNMNNQYVAMSVKPEMTEGQLHQNYKQKLNYKIVNNKVVSLSDEMGNAMFYTLAEKPGAHISMEALIVGTARRIHARPHEIESQVRSNALNYLFRGILDIDHAEDDTLAIVPKMPHIWSVAREQALRQTWVTTSRYSVTTITKFDQHLIQLLNGKISKHNLVQAFLETFNNGVVVQDKKGNKITDKEQLHYHMGRKIADSLQNYMQRGLLTSVENYRHLPQLNLTDEVDLELEEMNISDPVVKKLAQKSNAKKTVTKKAVAKKAGAKKGKAKKTN